MSQYGYGNNPYAQQDDRQPGYGQPSPRYGGPAMGRDDYGSNVEMEPLTGTGSSFPRSGGDKMALLNECKEIREQGLTTINALIAQIESTQRSILSSADSRYTESQTLALEDTRSELIEVFRTWTKRVQALKSHPEANSGMNKGQIATVAGQITAARDRYNAVGVSFKKKSDEQTARQYRIVMGEGATDADIQDAMEDPNQNVFAQALMTSTRQGQAQSTLSAVKQRSEAIKQIESQMIELGDLFEQMNTLVEQQEAAVTQIEMKGEEVVENMSKGTEQIGVAIESARNTRKWKWWCLGICVLIVIIIVVVVLIYKFVIQTPVTTTTPAATTKRFVLTDSVPANRLSTAGHAVVRGNEFKPASKLVVPGLAWKDDRLVVPGVDYVPGSRKTRRFQA